MNIELYLNQKKKLIDATLDQFLPKTSASRIAQVMRYSVFAGGKRFRPILMLAVAETLGKPIKKVLPAAGMVELIHTFTLIHDDLPCMDNDDFRRGKLTAHKKFGEDLAVLSGDALQALAYEIMLKQTRGVTTATLLKTLKIMFQAIGHAGVVTGQVLDLDSEKKKISLVKLKEIHLKKTAALIQAAVKIAATLCQASPAKLKKLDQYALHLGLAFQIADDLLDYTSSFAKMGKTPGKDQRLAKATYVTVLGKKQAEKLLAAERNKAHQALKVFGKRGQILKELAEFVIKRNR